jgi:hypothetical protein
VVSAALAEHPRVEEAPKPPVVDVTRQEEVADPPPNAAPSARTAEAALPSDGRPSKRSPQEGLAQLHVIVYPWGYVWVDGVLRGESPADLPRITPGRHVVGIGQSVDGPAKTFRVRLKPGANEQEYSLR